MNSLIFRCTASVLLPVMLVISVIVLLRGHNEPGGGFVGGLLAAAGFSLYALAYRGIDARRLVRMDLRMMIGIGMLLAVLSGVPALFTGTPYLKGHWVSLPVPGFPDPLKIGTPFVFDLGVYLLVAGGTLLIALSLEGARRVRPVRS